MNRLVLAVLLLCFALLPMESARAQVIASLVDQTTPFRDPAVNGDVVYNTGDELASLLVFGGARRITHVTFKYTSRVPVNYTVRFYRLPAPILPQPPVGPPVKTVTFTDLPAGTSIVTRELTPEQQFDWVATLNYDGNFTGGFYSVQMTRADGSPAGGEAGFPLATPGPGAWQNFTRGGGEDPVSVGLIPFRPEFEEVGPPAVGFFIRIDGFEVAAPAPVTLSSLSLSANAVVGGAGLTGTVTMSAPVAEDTTVPVRANALYVRVPATVTVPAGARSVTFPITTGPSDLNRSVPVQATYAGRTAQQFLVVTPDAPVLYSLTLSASSVRGGTGLNGVLTLNGPFGQARTVTVSNGSDGSVVQTPLTVTVPAGAQFAVFPITTSPVSRNQTVVIRATFAGKTVQQTLTVTRRR